MSVQTSNGFLPVSYTHLPAQRGCPGIGPDCAVRNHYTSSAVVNPEDCLPYHAAGNSLSRISGGLTVVIVRHGMDDNRFSGKLIGQKAFRIEGQPGLSAGRLQNGHISGVRRMGTGSGIVMSFRIGKVLPFRSAAGRSFMDMEAEEAGPARSLQMCIRDRYK